MLGFSLKMLHFSFKMLGFSFKMLELNIKILDFEARKGHYPELAPNLINQVFFT